MTKQNITSRISNWLDQEGCKYEYNEELDRYVIWFDIDREIESIAALITINDEDFDVDFPFPEFEIKDTGELIDFLMRVNFNTRAGQFQYDFDENTIWYHKYICLAGDTILTDEILGRSIRGGLFAIEDNCDYIVRIARGEIKSLDAIKELENNSNNEESEENDEEYDLNDVRYNLEHRFMPERFLSDPSGFIDIVNDKNGLCSLYNDWFDEFNVENPYSDNDFAVYNTNHSPYCIKKLVLPKSDEKILCEAIYLVYVDEEKEEEGYRSRYITLENEYVKGKKKPCLCEWVLSDEGLEHVFHCMVNNNSEMTLQRIKQLLI